MSMLIFSWGVVHCSSGNKTQMLQSYASTPTSYLQILKPFSSKDRQARRPTDRISWWSYSRLQNLKIMPPLFLIRAKLSKLWCMQHMYYNPAILLISLDLYFFCASLSSDEFWRAKRFLPILLAISNKTCDLILFLKTDREHVQNMVMIVLFADIDDPV